MKTNLRRAFGSALRGSLLLAFVMGAWSTAAQAQGTTKIQSPTSGSTITCNGSQQSISVEVVIDNAWSYYGFVVTQDVGGGTIKPISSGDMQQITAIYDAGGKYLYSVASMPRPKDGTGYIITIRVYQMVADDMGGEKQVIKEVQVDKITVTTSN